MTAFTLTTDQQALLATALAADEEEAGRHWSQFLAAYDFEDVWDGERYSLLPSVHATLGGEADPARGPRLAGIHRRTWVANQRALLAGSDALGALDRVGVGACLHGDLAVAATIYPDLGSRLGDPVELLVSAETATAAVAALGAAGWVRSDPRPLGPLVDHDDGTVLERAGGDRLRVTWRSCRGVAPHVADDAVVAEAVATPAQVPTEHGPLPITPPAVLAAHALSAGVGSLPGRLLRSLCDAGHLVDRDAFGADDIVETVDRLQIATVAAAVVGAVAEAGGPEDEALTRSLAAARPRVPERVRRSHAALVAAATTGPPSRARALRADWARRRTGLGPLAAATTAPGFLAARWGSRSALSVPLDGLRRLRPRAAPAHGASR